MKKQQFIDAHITASARKYVDGMRQAGLPRTPILTKAMAVRAVRDAHAAYDKRYPYRKFFKQSWLIIALASGGSVFAFWVAVFQTHNIAGVIVGVFIGLCFLAMAILAWRMECIEREIEKLSLEIVEGE
jgi:cadmium resistance protein CadD (predicted permease)